MESKIKEYELKELDAEKLNDWQKSKVIKKQKLKIRDQKKKYLV